MSTILNITRVHNAVTACGLLGRGLAIGRAFAPVRCVRGKKLMDIPAYVKTMAAVHVEYRASMLLTFFVITLLGVSEKPIDPQCSRGRENNPLNGLVPSDSRTVALFLRILTPVMKALTAKNAIAGLAECMESLGGVGYLDSSSSLDIGNNVARLYRDANVLSIWEGTTDVMADDAIRVLKGKGGTEILSSLDGWLSKFIKRSFGLNGPCCDSIERIWTEWAHGVRSKGNEELSVNGSEAIEGLGWAVSAVLLMEDARRDGNKVAAEVAARWIGRKDNNREMILGDWEKEAGWDRHIVFGENEQLLAKL